MSPDSPRGEMRELRLEGLGLGLAGALLLALVGGAFVAGRWYERRTTTERAGSAPDASTALPDEAVRPPVDVGAEAGHFDRVEGREQQLEPGREARRTSPAPASLPGGRVSAPAAPGGFFVQVFAGRDASAARGIVERLEQAGQRVVLHAEPEGGGQLFKVRIGGFPSEAEARETARRLQGQGFPGAWVTRGEAP